MVSTKSRKVKNFKVGTNFFPNKSQPIIRPDNALPITRLISHLAHSQKVLTLEQVPAFYKEILLTTSWKKRFFSTMGHTDPHCVLGFWPQTATLIRCDKQIGVVLGSEFKH